MLRNAYHLLRASKKVIWLLFLVTAILFFAVFYLKTDYSYSQTSAAIKSGAAVSDNSVNKIVQQLKFKETILSQKEKNLAEQSRPLIYLSVGGGILFILILLNFYFDYRRKAS